MSVSKWAYDPNKCEGALCIGECDRCPKVDERSPIGVINEISRNLTTKINEQTEELMVQAVAEIGIEVDKEELKRALNTSRNVYEQGKLDGIEKEKERWARLYMYIADYRLAVAPDERTPEEEIGYRKAVVETLDMITGVMERMQEEQK